jgi:hypothetical protein
METSTMDAEIRQRVSEQVELFGEAVENSGMVKDPALDLFDVSALLTAVY